MSGNNKGDLLIVQGGPTVTAQYQLMAASAKEVSEIMAKPSEAGITFSYHNHYWGFPTGMSLVHKANSLEDTQRIMDKYKEATK